MKTLLKTIGTAALSVMIGMGSSVTGFAADWVTTSHAVTVAIPEILSISADTASFTLSFSGYVKTGDESTTKTVNYTVESNNMRQADGSAGINANLDFLYDRLDMKADIGNYVKTSGNTGLVEAASGFVTLGTANVALANKGNTTINTDGKLLRGSIPITYKAVATSDVPSGDQTHVLFITLTTI